jgi:hypothetical protein
MCEPNMASYYEDEKYPDYDGCGYCDVSSAPLAAASPLVAIVFREKFAVLGAKPRFKFYTHYNRGSGVKLTWGAGHIEPLDEFRPGVPDESRLWLAWAAACERPDVTRMSRNRDFLENMPYYIVNRTISVKQAAWLLDLGE